jgi:ubiquinone/menaquinone biosynthesis C-methylase UbiE
MITMLRKIKNLLKPLSSTPLHPQWLAARHQGRIRQLVREAIQGPVVLDLGCGTKWPQALLPESCRYVGLDYPETAEWYQTKPDVFGDAQRLPFASSSINTVLMVDVLEHLPNPRQALDEAARCLGTKGTLILIVPFLYPIHDAPHDYQRWSAYGLKKLVGECEFTLEKEAYSGNPLETATLLSNIALTKTVFNWISKRHIASLLVLLLPFCILIRNLLARLLSTFAPEDAMMPISYQMVLRKK